MGFLGRCFLYTDLSGGGVGRSGVSGSIGVSGFLVDDLSGLLGHLPLGNFLGSSGLLGSLGVGGLLGSVGSCYKQG